MEIIKQPENYNALTKEQAKNNLRHHLLMMLEAMQYKGSTHAMSNSQLRELVDEQQLIFLRKLQREMDFKAMYGRSK